MKALIHDWETTGFPLHPDAKLRLQPRAIEFGAIVIDQDGVEYHQESILIYPECHLEPVITKVTGLTDADLEGKPLFAEVYPTIKACFDMVDIIASHNLPFDKSIMQFELTRLGVTDFVWPRLELCTVQTFQEEWGKFPSLKALYKHVMGKPLEQTHRALDDCRALAEIVIKTDLLRLFQ